MPGKTTITIFRHRLERRGLAHLLFNRPSSLTSPGYSQMHWDCRSNRW